MLFRSREKKSRKEKKQERAAAKNTAQAAAPAEVAEPIKWCWFYNNGLRGGRDCTNRNCKHDHVRVEDNIFKKTPAPQRTRSNSPAARGPPAAPGAEAKGGGKGGGKGGEQGKGKNDGPKNYKKPGAFHMENGKKVPYYCKKFLEGNCTKNAKDCSYHHYNQAQLDKQIKSLNAA